MPSPKPNERRAFFGCSRAERRSAVGVALVGSLCLLASVSWAQSRERYRIDGLAAVVGGTAPGPDVDVVLRSDVELRARMALGGRGVEISPHVRLPAKLLAASLVEIMGELLIAREAKRVQVARPGKSELVREQRRLERSAGGRARLLSLLRAMGASRQEVDAIAQRRVLVAAFLQANLEGATVVTDAEVRQAYEGQRGAFANVDEAHAMAAVRARLVRNALDRRIERWVSVLSARTPSRRFVEYSD